VDRLTSDNVTLLEKKVMAKKAKRKVGRPPNAKKKKVGRPANAKNKIKVKAKAKAKAKTKVKAKKVVAVAARKPRDSARYLVINTLNCMTIKTLATLTPEIRQDARLGIITVIDCQRVLVMTPKGAWSVLGDGFYFISSPPLAESFVEDAVPPPLASFKNEDFETISATADHRFRGSEIAQVTAPSAVAEESEDDADYSWASPNEAREPIAASSAGAHN